MAADYWIPTQCIIQAIFDSFSYNRADYHMFLLCEEIRERIDNNSEVIWTDDGDIIYGILVLLYGDYGTSPRSGWIQDLYIENVKLCVNDIIEEYKRDIRGIE